MRRTFALAVICLGVFVISVDATIVNVALPTLSRELNADTAPLQWIVDAYTLVMSGLLLSAGSLSDRYGRRGWLNSGLAMFAITSGIGGPTTHVHDVAGVEPEEFLTIARRYVTGPESRRTASNFIRQVVNFMLTGFVPMHRLDTFDRLQQHPQPAHPQLSGQSVVWQNEHDERISA